MNYLLNVKYSEPKERNEVRRTFQRTSDNDEDINLPLSRINLPRNLIKRLSSLLPRDSLRSKKDEEHWFESIRETRDFSVAQKEVQNEGRSLNLFETLRLMNTFDEAIKKIRNVRLNLNFF